MPHYVAPTEQLVTEILVADIERSVRFYLDVGFNAVARRRRFRGR